ncbi:MAG: hypothetical protein FGM32_01955 [Candidatus Kapabacteria bacterium]|nr:hypothetical protein [Candidatus Kapabacteria bacterium]
MRSLIIGATGLVGTELVKLLVDDARFTTINVLTRRPLDINDPTGRVRNVVKDFDTLDGSEGVYDVDVVFSAMGSTIKTAGSAERYRLFDYEYPIRIARFARTHGAKHWIMVSSFGIKPNSRFLYIQVKHALEQDTQALGFDRLTILRPSFILGDRREHRAGERIGIWFAQTFAAIIPRAYRAVHARAIAATMIRAATDGSERPFESISNEFIHQ